MERAAVRAMERAASKTRQIILPSDASHGDAHRTFHWDRCYVGVPGDKTVFPRPSHGKSARRQRDREGGRGIGLLESGFTNSAFCSFELIEL